MRVYLCQHNERGGGVGGGVGMHLPCVFNWIPVSTLHCAQCGDVTRPLDSHAEPEAPLWLTPHRAPSRWQVRMQIEQTRKKKQI